MDLTTIAVTDIIRIGFAVLAGALIGLEREFRDKSAGFRTLIFISVGSAMFTILSENLSGDGDHSRIAAYVVSGIGFLGAGAILRDGMRVAGLTTAATIWLTAAVGMAMGSGQFLFGGLVTVVALIVLWAFPVLERSIDRIREECAYELVFKMDLKKVEEVESLVAKCGLKIVTHRHFKKGEDFKCRWYIVGKPEDHEKFIHKLLKDPEIKEFVY